MTWLVLDLSDEAPVFRTGPVTNCVSSQVLGWKAH